jgi:hypothetical protein
LYALIKEDVYVRQPLGFSDGTPKVCHLYGLKQSPREFKQLLREWLLLQGWTQCKSDPCIYVAGVFAMIGVYVDDLPLACNNPTWVSKFKSTLGSRFKTTDFGELQHIMGMHITRDRTARTIFINQSQYLANVLDKHGMTDCSPSALPMDLSFFATVG